MKDKSATVDINGVKYGRIEATCERYGISRATFYRWVRSTPDFPKPIHLGPRILLVDWSAIDAYLQKQATK